jgi:hypothetical protein
MTGVRQSALLAEDTKNPVFFTATGEKYGVLLVGPTGIEPMTSTV